MMTISENIRLAHWMIDLWLGSNVLIYDGNTRL